VTFAQVLAETAIRDAGVYAWRRVGTDPGLAAGEGSEDAWFGDGSRVSVWRAAGSWMAAYAGSGTRDATVIVLARQPTFVEAAVLGRLADTVIG
jgi:hypothetical protein